MKNFFKSIHNYLLACVVTKTFWSIIFLLCVLEILGGGFNNELKQLFIEHDLENHHITDILRNITLTLAGLIGFPFLVWRSEIADRTQKIAQEAQAISGKAHFTGMYIKAVEQLSDEKETIRLAGAHALIQLLEQSTNKDTLMVERILNVLWCFMVENSRDVLEIETDIHKKEIKKYHSQFRMILPILPKKYDRKLNPPHSLVRQCQLENNEEWWQSRKLQDIYLKGIDLSGTDMSCLDFSCVNLIEAILMRADFSYSLFFESDLSGTNLSGAVFYRVSFIATKLENIPHTHDLDMREAQFSETSVNGMSFSNIDFMGANLHDMDFLNCNLRNVQNLHFSILINARYNNKTKKNFPNGFKPKEHGMINVDEASTAISG